MKRKLFILAILLLFMACSRESGKDTVFVSILPLKYFATEIAGDKLEIQVMVPPGMSPATYEPLPAQMYSLSKAKILFTAGVPFEVSWLNKIESLNPDLLISPAYKGIDLTGKHTHSHGEDDHTDPHAWVDPLYAKIMVENITAGFRQLVPEFSDFFEENKIRLLGRLDSLHSEIARLTRTSTNEYFMIYHPALGYYAERYGLHQISVEVEGKEPSPSDLAGFIKIAREHGITQILVQRQFTTSAAKSIANELGVKLVEIDPLSENYIDSMKKITSIIVGEHGEQYN